MKTKQFITASLIGALTHFFLGWVVYGILLMDTMQAYSNTSLFRKDEDMIFWSIIIGSVSFGLLMSYFLIKTGVRNLKDELLNGALLGLLITAFMDFNSYGTSTVFNNLQIVFLDILAGTFVAGALGAVIGVYLQKIN